MKIFTPNSSMIKDVRWVSDSDNNNNGTMYVQFSNSNVYRYGNVSLSRFLAFQNADSAGTYFDKRIKNSYVSTRLPNGFPKAAQLQAVSA